MCPIYVDKCVGFELVCNCLYLIYLDECRYELVCNCLYLIYLDDCVGMSWFVIVCIQYI